jgi:hypothetical protein
VTDYILLNEDEVLGILDATELCAKCAGGRGLHIERGEVFGVTLHLEECQRTILRLVPPLAESAGADEAEQARRARIEWAEPGGGVA